MRDQLQSGWRGGSAVQRAATLLGGHILIGIASVLALVALSLIAGTLAFAAGGWPAFFLSLGTVLAIASLAVFIKAWMLIRTLRAPPEAEDAPAQRTQAAAPAEHAYCPPAAEPEPPPAAPVRPESLLAMAALGLGAAAVVGPVRLARMGLRAYSIWTTARTLIREQRNTPTHSS